jgi:hypothetical protein
MVHKPLLYSAIPFVGIHKVHQLEILECVGIGHTTFGPLVDIHKGWVRGGSRTPLLDEPLKVELLLGHGELSRTVANGLEGDGIGVDSTRHGSMRRRDDWMGEGNGDW